MTCVDSFFFFFIIGKKKKHFMLTLFCSRLTKFYSRACSPPWFSDMVWSRFGVCHWQRTGGNLPPLKATSLYNWWDAHETTGRKTMSAYRRHHGEIPLWFSLLFFMIKKKNFFLVLIHFHCCTVDYFFDSANLFWMSSALWWGNACTISIAQMFRAFHC